MSNGTKKRTRQERVAALRLPPGKLIRALADLRRGDVLLRLGLVLGAAVLLWVFTAPWNPPFRYRQGDAPQRDILARVKFQVPDHKGTDEARQRARDMTPWVYRNDPKKIIDTRGILIKHLEAINKAGNAGDVEKVWEGEFKNDPDAPENAQKFQKFQADLRSNTPFQAAIEKVLEPYEKWGLLQTLQPREGNLDEIAVYNVQTPEEAVTVPVSTVRFDDAIGGKVSHLKRALEANFGTSSIIVPYIHTWLRDKFSEEQTLTLDKDRSEQRRALAAQNVPPRTLDYLPAQQLVAAGEVISPVHLDLLKQEYGRFLGSPLDDDPSRHWSIADRLSRGAAMLGVILVTFTICGGYCVLRERRLGRDAVKLTMVLVLAVTAVSLAVWFSSFALRAELLPLLLFGMTMAIAYRRELALVFSTAAVSLVALAVGRGVGEFFVIWGVVATTVLLLTRLRSRLKVMSVCSAAAGVVMLLTLLVGVIEDRAFYPRIVVDAGLLAGWTLMAGFVVNSCLPLVEKFFGVLTDLSLLELGGISHPLLQELVRRAPGTYNHSINVASLSEAAADAIGARGLLCRVGAYFHDIGKMLKPGYFAENQGTDNRHESLAPGMSTIIIIAHIKDGADLARSYHLPEPIIDFIEQHHGTTVVEYFYNRAAEESRSNPDAAEVEEAAFRYPGPKPQTRETAVLMLADAVESASRTLADPTPSRIKSLVEEIIMKRLMDDQFDECAITMREIRVVQDSLIKSLTAVYHGRIKYPNQRTA